MTRIVDRDSQAEALIGLADHGEKKRALLYARRRVGKTYLLANLWPREPPTRTSFSPPEILGVDKHRVMGDPDPHQVSTPYIERQNSTMRMNVRRLTRLTNGFSKKIENHKHALSLHYMYYNFVRKHQTLTKQAGGIHKTPAMAADVADHVWRTEEVVGLPEVTE